MQLNTLRIYLILYFCVVATNDKRYNGFIKNLEILNYDTKTLNSTYMKFLKNHKYDRNSLIEFTIKTEQRQFQFCLKLKTDEPLYRELNTLYFIGHLCENVNSSAHGYIEEGVFYGRVEILKDNGTYINYVFSDLSYVKDKLERNRGHSILYRSDQLDHELLSKTIKRIPHTDDARSKYDEKLLPYNIKIERSLLSGEEIITDYNTSFARSAVSTGIKNICNTHVDLHPSYIKEKRSQTSAILDIISMFETINKIYKNNFLRSDGKAHIQYKISSFRVLSGRELTEMNNVLPNVNAVVNKFNDASIFSKNFCSRVFLTHTNWAQTLGMAKIGTKNGVGICGFYDGIVVTSNLMDEKVDTLTLENTIMHEFGHTLGSPHDPVYPCTSKPCFSQAEVEKCSPGGRNGMYIMYFSSNSGAFPNNKKFSPCSRKLMLEMMVEPKRTKCLTDMDSAICGNSIIEKGEQCDSGIHDDNCCTKPSNNAKGCTLKENAECSGSEGSCCTADCKFSPVTTVCKHKTECAGAQICSGNSAICPAPRYAPKNTLCSSESKACDGEGSCILSLCALKNKIECDCPKTSNECILCCKDIQQNSVCETYRNSKNDIIYKSKGDLCKNNKGICSENHTCLEKIDDAGFSSFWLSIVNGKLKADILDFIHTNLWKIIVGCIGFLLILIIISIFFKKDTAFYLRRKYDTEQKAMAQKQNSLTTLRAKSGSLNVDNHKDKQSINICSNRPNSSIVNDQYQQNKTNLYPENNQNLQVYNHSEPALNTNDYQYYNSQQLSPQYQQANSTTATNYQYNLQYDPGLNTNTYNSTPNSNNAFNNTDVSNKNESH